MAQLWGIIKKQKDIFLFAVSAVGQIGATSDCSKMKLNGLSWENWTMAKTNEKRRVSGK